MNQSESMISAVAIDDEPRALEIMQIHAGKVPFLNLLKTFRDPLDAINWIAENPTDLLFLDINMPQLSGLKFRSLIGEQTMIIFTTAYSEFAAESYEQNAIDYLVKPIRFERFLKAVIKAKERNSIHKNIRIQPNQEQRPISKNRSSIFVKSGTKSYRLHTDDILYLQKDGNYVVFYTNEKKVLSRLNMGQIKEILPHDSFVRIHKSFVINLNKIDILENHQVTIQNKAIPIAKAYREELARRI